MNIFKTWLLFHKPERRFHELSYEFMDAYTLLNRLNGRRMIIQNKIFKAGSASGECEKCKGMCCRGEYNHFTVVDYFIRIFSEKPIQEYGRLWKPESYLSMLLQKVRPVSRPGTYQNNEAARSCPNLSAEGCVLEPQDRPIRCLLWTCRAFRESLPPDRLEEMGRLMKELGSISDTAMKVLKYGKG